ncbi:hypothetical protein FPOA_13443, partial [Fusarium poae]
SIHSSTASGASTFGITEVQQPGGAKAQGFFMCECCPKKPKRFESLEELNAHEAEKQYKCSFCGNRFKIRTRQSAIKTPFMCAVIRGHAQLSPDTIGPFTILLTDLAKLTPVAIAAMNLYALVAALVRVSLTVVMRLGTPRTGTGMAASASAGGSQFRRLQVVQKVLQSGSLQTASHAQPREHKWRVDQHVGEGLHA